MVIQKVDLKCGNKDIPIPSQVEIKKMIVRRTYEHFVRLRWRILVHLHPEKLSKERTNTYGFKSGKFPKSVECDALKGFENDLMDMVKNMEFRDIRCSYQNQLKREKWRIRQSKHLILESDKTGNLYEVDKATYTKLLTDEVTKTYKKTHRNKTLEMDQSSLEATKKLKIEDRVMRTKKANAFLSLKDHKRDFGINPTMRLINPACQESGKAVQMFLKKIVRHVKDRMKLNLWENTTQALD